MSIVLESTRVRPQELTMASSLIDSLSSDFDPDEYHDDYREALLGVIDRKLAGGAGVPADTATVPEDEGDAIVVDLMAALRVSVKRPGTGEAARVQQRPARPAAKTAPKKAAA
jgi:DNA end-binding protein Ku